MCLRCEHRKQWHGCACLLRFGLAFAERHPLLEVAPAGGATLENTLTHCDLEPLQLEGARSGPDLFGSHCVGSSIWSSTYHVLLLEEHCRGRFLDELQRLWFFLSYSWVFAHGLFLGYPVTSCESCKHFTGRSGPHGICSIWQRALTVAMAAVQRCSLWQGRGG